MTLTYSFSETEARQSPTPGLGLEPTQAPLAHRTLTQTTAAQRVGSARKSLVRSPWPGLTACFSGSLEFLRAPTSVPPPTSSLFCAPIIESAFRAQGCRLLDLRAARQSFTLNYPNSGQKRLGRAGVLYVSIRLG